MSEQNPEAVKQSLLKAPWKKFKEIDVEGEAGTVQLVVRRPPPKWILAQLKQMQAEGLVDEEHRPASEEAGLIVSARLIAPMLFLPGARQPLLTPEEFADASWAMDVVHECTPALGGTAQMVEQAKGN